MNTWTAQNRSVSDGALVVKDADFNEICVIRQKAERSYGPQDIQDKANAALIAAAPELVAALQVLADIPLEAFGHEKRQDSYPIMGWNEHTITVGHVKQARKALAKAGA